MTVVNSLYQYDKNECKKMSEVKALTACACLMKSRISSCKALYIFCGPLSSQRQTECTALKKGNVFKHENFSKSSRPWCFAAPYDRHDSEFITEFSISNL